jgi:membrane associated rhomboid family serine protease
MVPLGFLLHSMALPAWAMLVYWAFLQLAGGMTRIASEETGGVAFWAHLGGFLAGVVLIKVFEQRDRVRAHTSHHWRPTRSRGWR